MSKNGSSTSNSKHSAVGIKPTHIEVRNTYNVRVLTPIGTNRLTVKEHAVTPNICLVNDIPVEMTYDAMIEKLKAEDLIHVLKVS